MLVENTEQIVELQQPSFLARLASVFRIELVTVPAESASPDCSQTRIGLFSVVFQIIGTVPASLKLPDIGFGSAPISAAVPQSSITGGIQ
jgi:hypothetical protein